MVSGRRSVQSRHATTRTATWPTAGPEHQLCQKVVCHIINVLTGANGEANAEANEAATQKALPPWMLRQGITSIAPGGLPLAGPVSQAASSAAAAIGAAAGNSSEGLSSEEDQKRIEVGV